MAPQLFCCGAIQISARSATARFARRLQPG